MNIYYPNFHSLNNKLYDILNYDFSNIDIITLTETLLDSATYSSEFINVNDFFVIHHDRGSLVCAKIHIETVTLFVINVYIPPDTNNDQIRFLAHTIIKTTYFHGNNLLILGDFNMPNYINFF